MASATIDQAYDDIIGAFKTAWDAGVDTAELPVLYPNREGDPPLTDDSDSNPKGYAKLFIQHDSGFQATLSDSTALQRWRSTGIVTAQLFAGSATGKLWTSFVKTVISAWRGVTTTNGVIFRRVAPVEVGIKGSYFQVNVIAAFEYDEIA